MEAVRSKLTAEALGMWVLLRVAGRDGQCLALLLPTMYEVELRTPYSLYESIRNVIKDQFERLCSSNE